MVSRRGSCAPSPNLIATRPRPQTQAKREWEEQAAKRQREAGAERPREEESAAPTEQFVAYVPLPDAEEIEARVLASKKAALLSKYASESLQQEQAQARELLRRR